MNLARKKVVFSMVGHLKLFQNRFVWKKYTIGEKKLFANLLKKKKKKTRKPRNHYFSR